MNAKNLTSAQTTLLTWYFQKETNVHYKSRVKTHHNPRVVLALCDAGLLAVTHHHYGPHYGLTEAGRAMFQVQEVA